MGAALAKKRNPETVIWTSLNSTFQTAFFRFIGSEIRNTVRTVDETGQAEAL